MYIELYQDHSGVTYSSITKQWAIIPVALAGYITASLFAWFLFSAYSRGKQRLGLQVMIVLSVLSLVLFVRNGFGIMFLVGFIALTVIVLALTPKWLRDFYYLLLAFLCLEESVFGPFSLIIYAWGNAATSGRCHEFGAAYRGSGYRVGDPIYVICFVVCEAGRASFSRTK